MMLYVLDPIDDVAGPVSLQSIETIFKSYQEQKYLAGLLALVSVILLLLIVSLLRSQRRAEDAQIASSLQTIGLVVKATEAMGATAAATVEVRRSLESNTTEMRTGFALVTAELRQVESTATAAGMAIQSHIEESEKSVIDAVKEHRCGSTSQIQVS